MGNLFVSVVLSMFVMQNVIAGNNESNVDDIAKVDKSMHDFMDADSRYTDLDIHSRCGYDKIRVNDQSSDATYIKVYNYYMYKAHGINKDYKLSQEAVRDVCLHAVGRYYAQKDVDLYKFFDSAKQGKLDEEKEQSYYCQVGYVYGGLRDKLKELLYAKDLINCIDYDVNNSTKYRDDGVRFARHLLQLHESGYEVDWLLETFRLVRESEEFDVMNKGDQEDVYLKAYDEKMEGIYQGLSDVINKCTRYMDVKLDKVSALFPKDKEMCKKEFIRAFLEPDSGLVIFSNFQSGFDERLKIVKDLFESLGLDINELTENKKYRDKFKEGRRQSAQRSRNSTPISDEFDEQDIKSLIVEHGGEYLYKDFLVPKVLNPILEEEFGKINKKNEGLVVSLINMMRNLLGMPEQSVPVCEEEMAKINESNMEQLRDLNETMRNIAEFEYKPLFGHIRHGVKAKEQIDKFVYEYGHSMAYKHAIEVTNKQFPDTEWKPLHDLSIEEKNKRLLEDE